MKISVEPCTWETIQPWRERHRLEMACQIVHDSLHQRAGWTEWFLIQLEAELVGYAAVAVAGPWAGTRTVFELFLAHQHRPAFLDAADALIAEARIDHILAQSNDFLMTRLLYHWGHDIATEKVIFSAGGYTGLPSRGAQLRRTADLDQSRRFVPVDEPMGEWALEHAGEVIATGGYLEHYNPPYVDLFLEVRPDHRREGFGSYFLQELQRIARAAQRIPCGRAAIHHVASRRTMARAGMVPCGQILIGRITPP